MLILLVLFSCQKEIKRTPPTEDSSVIFPQTAKEKERATLNKEVASILETVYKNRKAVNEVCNAINTGYYEDETILLKDLLFPEISPVYKMQRFINSKAPQGIFKTLFLETLGKGDYPVLKSKLNTQEDNSANRAFNITTNSAPVLGDTANEIFRRTSGVSIYFPYSENFPGLLDQSYIDYPNIDGPNITLVPADREADFAPGQQPYWCSPGVNLCYRIVTVNDAYAELKATHIVGVGAEPSGSGNTPYSAFPPGPPEDIPNLSREVKQVYVGDVRMNGVNYDKLISLSGNGGGSEIRFTRSDGFLKLADGQVQADNYVIGDRKEIKRKDIRKKRWVNYSLEWDGDWELANFQQNLAIYEEDNRNTSSFSGTLSTTLAITVTPLVLTTSRTIGFTINFKSDDAIIKQTNYNRDVFFTLNRTNLEGEMYNGWPVRDRYGNVSFTLNDRTYY